MTCEHPGEEINKNIRDYRASDFDGAIALWWDSWHSSSGYRHHRPIEDWQQRWHDLEKTHQIVVVDLAGTVIAFAALNVSACVLSQIFVSPEWKGQGWGKQLLDWVSHQCPDGFSLKTAADNAEAIAFYKSAGLKQTGFSINDFNGKQEIEFVATTR